MTSIQNIDRAYGRIEQSCKEIEGVLSTNFSVDHGWYNGHYHRAADGSWVREAYPIPVISVNGVCDIEIEFDHINISSKLSKEQAVRFPYEEIASIPFETYGVEDYLSDLYHSGMSLSDLRRNISDAKEQEIGFSFRFVAEVKVKDILSFVLWLKEVGFYY